MVVVVVVGRSRRLTNELRIEDSSALRIWSVLAWVMAIRRASAGDCGARGAELEGPGVVLVGFLELGGWSPTGT